MISQLSSSIKSIAGKMLPERLENCQN